MADGIPLHLVFMLEEESAKHFLEELLPKILPPGVYFQCIPHQGKSDLQKSIPRKLQAWQKPNSFFVILHDLDSNKDCVALKDKLRELCPQPRRHTTLIRIVCQELESWYFGDLKAVQTVFPKFKADRYERRGIYRVPDGIVNPGEELKNIFKKLRIAFNKNSMAKDISKHMDINNNTSTSFNHTITGVRNLVETQLNAQN